MNIHVALDSWCTMTSLNALCFKLDYTHSVCQTMGLPFTNMCPWTNIIMLLDQDVVIDQHVPINLSVVGDALGVVY